MKPHIGCLRTYKANVIINQTPEIRDKGVFLY